MGRKDAVKLTGPTVDALSIERGNRVFWDRDMPGFGVRVHASGRKVYVAQARIPRGLPKRIVIGPHGEVATEDARREAAR
ncbi:MAG: Arm DNA-binding domain-containing protein, partial [Rhodospirillaceae bacterium]|nr:Arm DNA-binding domain-containing protein [Rhodospirillaceae bacterium]